MYYYYHHYHYYYLSSLQCQAEREHEADAGGEAAHGQDHPPLTHEGGPREGDTLYHLHPASHGGGACQAQEREARYIGFFATSVKA